VKVLPEVWGLARHPLRNRVPKARFCYAEGKRLVCVFPCISELPLPAMWYLLVHVLQVSLSLFTVYVINVYVQYQ
jgi:hypothetical protein